MESLFVLIPLALVSTGIALKAFFWAVANRQFDDLDQAGRAILFDAELVRAAKPSEETASTAAPLESTGDAAPADCNRAELDR